MLLHPFPALPTRCIASVCMGMVVLGLSGGCRPKGGMPASPPAESPVPSEQSVGDFAPQQPREDNREVDPSLTEFQAVSKRIVESENRYLGTHQITRLQQEKGQAPDDDIGLRVNIELQLCWNHLRLGQIEKAIQAIDEAFSIVRASGNPPQEAMHKLRALVYLRKAEVLNCVQRHNCDCCVFPLAQGGVHSVREPIMMARRELLEILRLQPSDLEALWLLNLASQAVGDYPEGLAEQYRIAPTVFQSAPDAPKLGRFRDVAPEVGVDLFNLCGGAIVDDFNGDQRLDIVTSSYDPDEPLTLFFRKAAKLEFTQQTIEHQLGGLNCIAADYDGDDDLDLLVLRGAWLADEGQIRNSLLQNDGHGKFRDVSGQSGVGRVARPTQAAAWGDFDNDGDLDLFIGNESRRELSNDGSGDYPAELYRNNGDETFTDIAQELGVTNDRYCKGVAVGDYDNDGDLDIYVSNRGKNRLYRNDGNRFIDVAEQAGVLAPEGQSFASWFFDYDNDGWLDLFVAAYQASNADVAASYLGIPNQGEVPRLYRNCGDGTFDDATEAVGLNRVFLPMGANFGDIDNDGFLDIYLTTGRPDFATLTPNVMLRNDGGRAFQDVTTLTGLGHLQKGHGVAFADIDEDGDQDIYHQLGGFFPGDKFYNALFLNPGDPDQHKFINIKLHASAPNTRALGARIRVIVDRLEGNQPTAATVHRAVGAVSSFGGSPTLQAIGLGPTEAIQRIEVDWPRVDGVPPKTQTFVDVPLNSWLELSPSKPTATIIKTIPHAMGDAL